MNQLMMGLVVAALAATGTAADVQLTAAQIVEKSQEVFYYAGADLRVKMTMNLLTSTDQRRTRVLTMLRRNAPRSRNSRNWNSRDWNQRFFLYFHEPGDVRRMVFMVWKYPQREDDRWLFVPAVDLIRRIAASDKRSSFVGSDFTYEDISGRDLAADRHTLLREERLGERDCYVVQSVPVERAVTAVTASEYTKRIFWIDKQNFLPLKEEYYDERQELARVFTADEVRGIAGRDGRSYPTVVRRTMRNVKTGHRTEVIFDRIEYDLGLAEADFSERSMRTPPQGWIQ